MVAEPPEVGWLPDPRDLLGRLGWGLVLLFAGRVTISSFPFQVWLPEWWVRLGLELVNSSPVLLIGLGLLALVGLLNHGAEVDRQPRRRLVMVLLQGAVWVYLLVMPIQLGASLLVDKRYEERLTRDLRELDKRLKRMSPEEMQLSQQDRVRVQFRTERERVGRQLRLDLSRDLVRVIVTATVLIWALRFAVVLLRYWSEVPTE